MRKTIRSLALVSLVTFAAQPAFVSPALQPETPKAELPALITSCGQSPGATMLKVIFIKMKLKHEPRVYEINMLATADDLRAAQSEGQPYKSLIVVMGASLKGMGAAGISIDEELSRTGQLIAEAKKQGITVIGAHIEGMKRRAQGADVGDNTDELSIDAVAPNSDLLLINKDGNTDNRFSIIANEKNIPMVLVEKNLDLLDELKKIYSSS
ncbi:MAG: hypothetical protein JXB23_14420 [Candidatus Aminicenantes bacterium]|nr:hypothetical protein [Candidatus Aminicenantes bacterium]